MPLWRQMHGERVLLLLLFLFLNNNINYYWSYAYVIFVELTMLPYCIVLVL